MLRILVTKLNDTEYLEWDTYYKEWYTWNYKHVPIEDDLETLICKSKEEINKVIFLISLGLSTEEIVSILEEGNESNIPS